MDWRTFERIEPSFPKTGLVFLQGWGEPLLHPGLWEMVSRVKAAGAAAGFTTNGTLLNHSNLEQLIESEVNVIGVSLAGTTAATHERFRPACEFAAIDEALVTLGELKRKRQREYPHLHVAFLLLRSNLEEVRELAGLASRWRASQVVISNLRWIPTADMQQECTLLHPELWPRAAEVLEKAKREASKRGILLHYNGPGVGEPHPVCSENVLKACFVSRQGDVSPCVFTNFSASDARDLSHYSEGRRHRVEPVLFGNVREQSMPEIWNSEKARGFRKIFEDRLSKEHPGTDGLPTACAHCYSLVEQ